MTDLTDLHETNMDDTKFTKGLFVKMPNKAAPDFVLLDMSFKPHEFFTWCQDKMDSKGWVNIQILRSKDGSKLYGKLNDWKPEKSQEQIVKDTQNQKEATEVGMTLSDEDLAAMEGIPF